MSWCSQGQGEQLYSLQALPWEDASLHMCTRGPQHEPRSYQERSCIRRSRRDMGCRRVVHSMKRDKGPQEGPVDAQQPSKMCAPCP